MTESFRFYETTMKGWRVFLDRHPNLPLLRLNVARSADNPPRAGARNRVNPMLDRRQVVELHAALGAWLAEHPADPEALAADLAAQSFDPGAIVPPKIPDRGSRPRYGGMAPGRYMVWPPEG